MQLNTDFIHNLDLQVTDLTSQSIAVGSLKEQKGHSYLISLRKPKPGAERALSVTEAGPPSVLDYFLSPHAHTQHFPVPGASAWAPQGVPVNPGLSHPAVGTTCTWNGTTQGSSPRNDQCRIHRAAREALSCPEGHSS